MEQTPESSLPLDSSQAQVAHLRTDLEHLSGQVHGLHLLVDLIGRTLLGKVRVMMLGATVGGVAGAFLVGMVAILIGIGQAIGGGQLLLGMLVALGLGAVLGCLFAGLMVALITLTRKALLLSLGITLPIGTLFGLVMAAANIAVLEATNFDFSARFDSMMVVSLLSVILAGTLLGAMFGSLFAGLFLGGEPDSGS